MTFISVECSCLDTLYADGSKPLFYSDPIKATYAFNKSKLKSMQGRLKIQNSVQLPTLKDYNLYFGIHLNGQHILNIT